MSYERDNEKLDAEVTQTQAYNIIDMRRRNETKRGFLGKVFTRISHSVKLRRFISSIAVISNASQRFKRTADI